VTAVYFVGNNPKKVNEGWEYTIYYPTLKQQPALDRERAYILALFPSHQGEMHTFEAVIPIYQPSGLWDRILNAFNPTTWARAFARWVVEGVHGLLTVVFQQAVQLVSLALAFAVAGLAQVLRPSLELASEPGEQCRLLLRKP